MIVFYNVGLGDEPDYVSMQVQPLDLPRAATEGRPDIFS